MFVAHVSLRGFLLWLIGSSLLLALISIGIHDYYFGSPYANERETQQIEEL